MLIYFLHKSRIVFYKPLPLSHSVESNKLAAYHKIVSFHSKQVQEISKCKWRKGTKSKIREGMCWCKMSSTLWEHICFNRHEILHEKISVIIFCHHTNRILSIYQD